MQKVYDKLKELQGVLLSEFTIEEDLDEIPQELNELKKRYHKLERTIDEKEKILPKRRKRLRRAERSTGGRSSLSRRRKSTRP
jgi:predicted  nucleic acid-binding Zn-ribbon protein